MQKFITLTSLKVFFRELKRYIALAIRQQVNVTYSELVDLRNSGKLVAGRYYRITDYVTTVFSASGNERSAGHPFDVIVRAISENELSEHAYAAKHDGDDYFASANLKAWKIWYCLDNDLQKYAWADVENGKGVIYRMIDEWDNDCPYDFKNVQYKRFMANDNSPNGELTDLDGYYLGWGEDDCPHGMAGSRVFVWCYTFNHFQLSDDGSIISDNSFDSTVYIYSGDVDFEGGGYAITGGIAHNTISAKSAVISIDDNIPSLGYELNNIVFFTFNNRDISDDQSDMKAVRNNYIHSDCYYMTFLGKFTGNEFGVGCHHNVGGFVFTCNTFGNYFRYNTFGNDCNGNTLGNNCGGNTFGNGCEWNTFGNYVIQGTIGEGVNNLKINGGANNTSQIKDFIILNGTCSQNSPNKLIINFESNKKATQYAGLNSQGDLVIWCPADAV